MKKNCHGARSLTRVTSHLYLVVASLVLCIVGGAGADDAAPPPTREQIEADWLRQDVVRNVAAVTPEEDAAGACDGVKNGKWGFHTALQDNPWWQIDLGEMRPLGHLVIYNRCDHTAGRAAQLAVLLSEEGQDFEPAYQHDGTMFLGQPDGKPLTIKLDGKPARYVRLQVPGNNCLHLDEVEIYLAGAGENVALGRPATQSSVCEWSTRKATAHGGSYPTSIVVQQGLRLAASLQRLGEMNVAAQPAAGQGLSYADEIETLHQIQAAVEQLPASHRGAAARTVPPRALGRAPVIVG